MALGKKTEALENYKKSVTLNPGNEAGIFDTKDKKAIIMVLFGRAKFKKLTISN
jgi:hypothetical protein